MLFLCDYQEGCLGRAGSDHGTVDRKQLSYSS